ncbi:MAG: hypothetical protein PVH21_08920 [Myxococcales bacterium]|jgi:hypothetical protein
MKHLAIATALVLAVPSLASAQEARRIELEYVKATPACPHVSTAGPGVGVGLSSLGILSSIPVTAVGADYAHSPGMIAAGASLAALSVAGLITSSIFLHRKRTLRRQHERGRCEMALDPIIPGVRF